jgi:hypothetical protein
MASVRQALDRARQQHMLAVQCAIARGMGQDELHHDVDAFSSAARQLLRMCGTVCGGAPMFLVKP